VPPGRPQDCRHLNTRDLVLLTNVDRPCSLYQGEEAHFRGWRELDTLVQQLPKTMPSFLQRWLASDSSKNPILTLKYYNITLYSFTVTICYFQSEVPLMRANDLDIQICLVWVGQASDCSYKVYRSLLSSSLSFLPKFSCRAAMSR
jgi:hypothetical protein